MAASHVFADFPYHAFLGPGKFIRQRPEAGVEGLSNSRHLEPHGTAAADVLLLQKA